ncbi:transmembrane protein 109 [Chanos chanos]|uniref:Transmembrane protein 109 n=1 Tax=Chanos chanos TaxID=29144 RepID=A0A6J2W3Z6_CHACN|nr:transmembrane protein 109-like [Chanos chanos]
MSSKKFLVFGLLFAHVFATGCRGQAVPTDEAPEADSGLLSVVSNFGEELRRYLESTVGTNVIETSFENAIEYLESVFGPENIYTIAMFVEMLLRFVAEGAASGLNVIAAYVSEILRATGVDAKLPFPHFTPEGVSWVAKWALLALIGYWLLSIVLRVAVALLRRVFWLLKGAVALWLFMRIVSDPSTSTDTTAARLALLVIGYAVLSVVTASTGGKESACLENRLSSLEGRIKLMEKKRD